MIPNVQQDPRTRDIEFFRKYRLYSYLGVPLIVKGEPLGVLSLYTEQERVFAKEEVEFFVALAGQAAIAIQNSLLYRQAEMANKVKTEFLSVMSHELRTPLTAVIGYTGLLKDQVFGHLNPEQGQALEKVMNRSYDLLGMINGILEAAQIEAHEAHVERTKVPLNDFLSDLKSTYDMSLGDEVSLDWNIPPGLPVLATDAAKLKRILQNLIDNGIKFTGKGSLVISAGHVPESKAVKFTVSDDGTGISKEFLPHVFEMFRQADSSEKRSHGGAGLGLYIAKKYTELLGGTIEVQSEPGKGSSFAVSLPDSS